MLAWIKALSEASVSIDFKVILFSPVCMSQTPIRAFSNVPINDTDLITRRPLGYRKTSREGMQQLAGCGTPNPGYGIIRLLR